MSQTSGNSLLLILAAIIGFIIYIGPSILIAIVIILVLWALIRIIGKSKTTQKSAATPPLSERSNPSTPLVQVASTKGDTPSDSGNTIYDNQMPIDTTNNCILSEDNSEELFPPEDHDSNNIPSTVPDAYIDVPYWAHMYVYSVKDLYYASAEQKKFYSFFRTEFLNGHLIDLKGNTNYAFILMFDLIKQAEKHLDISLLENQLDKLISICPKVEKYIHRNIQQLLKYKVYKEVANNTGPKVPYEWISIGSNISIKGKTLYRGGFYVGHYFKIPYNSGNDDTRETSEKIILGGIIAPNLDFTKGEWSDNEFSSYYDMNPIQRWHYLSWLSKEMQTREIPEALLLHYLWGLQIRLFIDPETSLSEKEEIVNLLISLNSEVDEKAYTKYHIHHILDHALSLYFPNESKKFNLPSGYYNLYADTCIIKAIKGKDVLDGETAYKLFTEIYSSDIPSVFEEHFKEHFLKKFRSLKIRAIASTYERMISLPIITYGNSSYIQENISYSISLYQTKSTLYDENRLYDRFREYNSAFRDYNKFTQAISDPLCPLGYFLLPKYIRDKEKHIFISLKQQITEILTDTQGLINGNDLLKIWGVLDLTDKTLPKKYLDNILEGLNQMGFGLIPNYQFGQKRLSYNETCVIYKLPKNESNYSHNSIHTIELFLKLLSIVIYGKEVSSADYEFIKSCIVSLNSPKEYYAYLYAYMLWIMQKKQAYDKKAKDEVCILPTDKKEAFINLLLKATCINGNIDTKRIDALKKILPTLDSAPDSVHTMLHHALTDEMGFATIEKKGDATEYSIRQPDIGESVIQLDKRKLDVFKQQTEQAQKLLSDIFVAEDEKVCQEAQAPHNDIIEILKKLLEKDTWGKADIQELCGPGIMIGNLLEQINDYSYSKIEDTVVEEEDDIIYVTTEYKEHLI